VGGKYLPEFTASSESACGALVRRRCSWISLPYFV